MSAPVVLVPHTHWDREWYEPFQVFRLRLVDVLDDVIDRAEADTDFRFTLDGQLAAVEDYLEIRPDNRGRIAALVARGQLAVGPWQILLDEFLCSGETIVRNLEMGWRGASALGQAMPVGYLPDMFGHCSQMPQILARAGIGHACLWRGVPGTVREHRFRWVAPDGSSVLVEYLFDGYGNALDLFARPDRLAEAASAYREQTRTWHGDGPALGMLGSDHSSPRPDLMALARSAGLPVASLAEYVREYAADGPGPPVVTGEMRSHARGNILPGVISIRVGLKEAMARAERVVGEAERLAAQWCDQDHGLFLDLAWRKIIECTAHDSVTGCGVDETAEQVRARLAEAAQIGRAVRDRVVAALAQDVPSDAYVVVNPSPWARTMLVELAVASAGVGEPVIVELPDGTALPVQELGRTTTPSLLADETMNAADLVRVLRRIHGRELFGQLIESYDLLPGRLSFDVAEVPRTADFDLAALRTELTTAAALSPGAWNVRTYAEPRRTVLVAVPVPASGWAGIRVGQDGSAAAPLGRLAVQVSAAGRSMDNGDVRVEVADDGTLTIRGSDGTTLTGVGRLVDGGDRGDSYNYGPPAGDVLVSDPVAVTVEVVEHGPLRAAIEVVREYDWPVSLSTDPDVRSEHTVRVPVTSLVELRVGEPYVRLSVSFTNPAADHRLRLHVPLPAAVTTSAADGQFAVTTRGLAAEGGWGEFPLPTYPASAFVSAGDATVLLDHVTEYELVSGGAELALTLLRAVGWMSVNVHPLRDEPAGSQLAVPGAQYLGRRLQARLAVAARAGGWTALDAPSRAEEFGHDALVRRGAAPAGSPLPEPEHGIAVSGAGVAVSSVRARADGTEVRLVAMTDGPTTAVITGPFDRARRTDLLGEPLDDLPTDPGRLAVDLGPWEIATVRLVRSCSDLPVRTGEQSHLHTEPSSIEQLSIGRDQRRR